MHAKSKEPCACISPNKTDKKLTAARRVGALFAQTAACRRLERRKSEVSQGDAGNKPAPMSRKEKWKHAIKEYGSAMVAFHVVLSFTSFGICYVLVSSGVDMTAVAEKLGFSMDSQWVNSKIAGGSGTLVLAYAVHKLFTPVRMGITLSTTPILVRWLRRNGIWGFRY
nr:protein FAM210B, mitochondrial-like isoform X2 [Dermacentor andersoni]